METILINTGMKEYRLTEKGAPLRFNPSDPNVYARFVESMDKIKKIEQEQAAKIAAVGNGPDRGETILRIMHETDTRMKTALDHVFGCGNDFHAILEGVSLSAVAANGRRVIENLMDVLTPIMEQGASSYVSAEVEAAKRNRAQRNDGK